MPIFPRCRRHCQSCASKKKRLWFLSLPATSPNIVTSSNVVTSPNVVTAGCDSLHHLPNQCGDRRTKNCQIVKSFYIKNNKSMSGSLETYFWGLWYLNIFLVCPILLLFLFFYFIYPAYPEFDPRFSHMTLLLNHFSNSKDSLVSFGSFVANHWQWSLIMFSIGYVIRSIKSGFTGTCACRKGPKPQVIANLWKKHLLYGTCTKHVKVKFDLCVD